MNVPQLRFDGFDGEWKKTSMAQATSKIGDGIHATPKYSEVGKISFINGNNLQNEKIVVNENTKKIDEMEFKKHNIYLNPTSILYSINGTIGNLAFYNNEKVLLGKSAAYLNIDIKDYNKYFISLILRSNKVKKHFLGELTGTTIRNLSLKTIRETNFYSPTLLEQKKIADFFTLLNQKIEKQQEKIEKLEQFKKGMIQKIFSQELRFKNESGGEFPEWKTKQLKEFATKTVKKNKDMKVTNVISNSAKQGLISQRSYFKKDIANELNINGYYVISKGDFVYNPRISSESPYGPIHVYELEDDGIVSPLYLCFKTKNINSKFLKYFFMSSQWYKHIYTHGDSGARHDRVSIKDTAFFEMKISMPSLAEQEKISSFLTSLNLKVEKEKEKLMVLEEQKRGFMRGMFV